MDDDKRVRKLARTLGWESKSRQNRPFFETLQARRFKYYLEILTMCVAFIGVFVWIEEREAREEERNRNQIERNLWKEERDARETERELWAEERKARNEERAFNQEERIARAWQLLTTPATGNSGKKEAMEFLVSQRVPIRSIDLSCDRMGGGWHKSETRCERSVDLSDIKLQWTIMSRSNFQGVNFRDATIADSTLWGVNLEGAFLVGSDLSRSYFIKANLRGAFFNKSNLSDANFKGAQNILGAVWKDAWAWEGHEPKGLAGIEIEICEVEADKLFDDKPEKGCELRVME